MDARLMPLRKETSVQIQVREQIEAIRDIRTSQKREKYREVFGEELRPNHKQFLFR